MTRNEHDAALELERTAHAARECGAADFFREIDDLAPARPVVWLIVAWLLVVAAFAAILLAPAAAHATVPPKKTPPTSAAANASSVSGATATGGAGGAGGAATATTTTSNTATGGSASSSVQAGAMTGPVTAGNALTLEARSVTAPDVISYPTAPCRVAIGASGGWLGGALGFSGSVEDTNCTLRETSRQLWNVGQRDAAVQVLCLNPDARLALQASGVACKVERAAVAQDVVKP